MVITLLTLYITDNTKWSVLNCLKYLEAHVQHTSDSKEDIIDTFTRTFEKISNFTSTLSGLKRKAKKLANKVEEKFQRKEIVDFFEVLDQILKRCYDKNRAVNI